MGDYYYWAPPSSPKVSLPSCDMDSLHILTYIKLSGANNNNNTFINLRPTMKSLVAKDGRVLSRLQMRDSTKKDLQHPNAIIKQLRDLGYDLDARLDAGVRDHVLPIAALIQEKILPAVSG